MKRCVICLLIIACVMSSMLLSGCDLFNQASTEYDLYYTSNGDGTCYVSDIMVHADVTEDFTLKIPKKSPDKETVVAVKLDGKLTRLQPATLPRVVLAEDWTDFLANFKNSEDKDLSQSVSGLYREYDLSKVLDDEQKQDLLERYPLVEHTVFFVLSNYPNALLTAKNIGDAYTVADRTSYDQKVIAYIEETLSGKELSKTLNAVLYHGCEYMKHLSLPATVKEVEIPDVAFETVSFAGTTEQWAEVKTALHGSIGVSVACKNGQGSLPGNEFYKQDDIYDEPLTVCKIMLVADYEDMMIRMVESDTINAFDLGKASAYYILCSLGDCTTDRAKMELIDAFPMLEFYSFYIFDSQASEVEILRVSSLLATYAGYTEHDHARAQAKVEALNAYYKNN